jgi:hypothetical protein
MAVIGCARCGAHIGAWSRPGTICSRCREDDWAAHVEAWADRACERCGQVFTPRQPSAAYCSSPCRQAAYRARKAAVA